MPRAPGSDARHRRARDPGITTDYGVGGGLIYLVLWLYGLVIDLDSDANFIPVNTADNWLHFGLGVGMVALGALLWNGRPHRGTTGLR